MPVTWLPSLKGNRFLEPNMLLAILKSGMGHAIQQNLDLLLPNHTMISTLKSLHTIPHIYLPNHALAMYKVDGTPALHLVKLEYGDVPRRN